MKGVKSVIASCSDAERGNEVPPKHFDLKHADFMVLMATVNGGVAQRNSMIPMFAERLSQSADDDDLYEVFLRTNTDIQQAVPRQVSEFRSTFNKKLSLRKVFKPATSQPNKLLGRIYTFFRT